jgi:endonuclease/exonuclease/phosphatase family metal-dependent hydrolase
MRRRTFLQSSAGVLAGHLSGQETKTRLTTIAYNVLACLGYPRTPQNELRWGGARPQMEARMAQELLLYRPDIVTFSESVTSDAAARMAGLLGMNHAWFAPGVPSYKGYPIGFPGSIFTRFRIVESENAPYAQGRTRDAALFTRHWGRATVDTGRERIAVFSGHLFPHGAEVREREIAEMLAVMEQEVRKGGSILFQGDLNHTPEAPEYKRWTEAGLIDTFAARGTGTPLTANSVKPRVRIDYIWTAGPLAKRLREARVLNEGAFRTNPDDPSSFALSDHLPVMATFD